jgi:hypothetical protein
MLQKLGLDARALIGGYARWTRETERKRSLRIVD